jgi:hypothetical protein
LTAPYLPDLAPFVDTPSDQQARSRLRAQDDVTDGQPKRAHIA